MINFFGEKDAGSECVYLIGVGLGKRSESDGRHVCIIRSMHGRRWKFGR